MPKFIDGPASPRFKPLLFPGNITFTQLKNAGIAAKMSAACEDAAQGACVAWCIPFEIGKPILLEQKPVSIEICSRAPWLVFLHTLDRPPLPDGIISPMRGEGQLGEHAANYIFCYTDGTEEKVAIKRRHHLGTFQRRWGENCFEAVAHRKPRSLRAAHEQLYPEWGFSQTRTSAADGGAWVNWLWAWKNPCPDKEIAGIRFEPVSGTLVISALTEGNVADQPLRWQTRQKTCLRLSDGETFLPDLDENGLLQQIQLDLGQVISATPRLVYPNENWDAGANNQLPQISANEILLEYTAHPAARFHFLNTTIPVADLESHPKSGNLSFVPPANQRITLKVIEQKSRQPVAVKLHIHGEWGEYLAPLDRHRIPNSAWFEDYSVDFVHQGTHACSYISGESRLDLPLGKIYLEISKGFEIRPVRIIYEIKPDTREILIELEKVLPWRENSWVTADTHVHFLSPGSALLEGAGEGVNVVNLLASQWGELMTNVGDFDGKTTWGSREAGGDGEFLVRVGTENRQHVLGHISLLGYRGPIIAPMTTGGPDESALGDPIEILLTEWARQCKQQGGLVVLPHFPNPRAEHAASLVHGEIDALEMTSWGDLYSGIDPYSLSDWYGYLNCGSLAPALGGTDKLSANTAVGTVRTYARLAPDQPFTYENWMNAVRRAETFVSYGPLLEFSVEGRPMGSRIKMMATGGTVDIEWHVASVTIPPSRVELVVNGEIRESLAVEKWEQQGHWSLKIDKSAWAALRVRGHYPDRPEIIAAHSTPVLLEVADTPLLAAADAITILEQIEGALAYLDTLGTRADDAAYKRMRLVLTSAHRNLHNRMHQKGFNHVHSPVDDHPAH